jgi:hypothetical protein
MCELALQQRAAEVTAGAPWSEMHRALESIKVVQLEGPHRTVWQTALGTPKARNLLRNIKIEPPPLILAAE